jgi:hypothetical protein
MRMDEGIHNSSRQMRNSRQIALKLGNLSSRRLAGSLKAAAIKE